MRGQPRGPLGVLRPRVVPEEERVGQQQRLGHGAGSHPSSMARTRSGRLPSLSPSGGLPAPTPGGTAGFLPFEGQPSYSRQALLRRLKKPGLRVSLFSSSRWPWSSSSGPSTSPSPGWSRTSSSPGCWSMAMPRPGSSPASSTRPDADTHAMRAIGGLSEHGQGLHGTPPSSPATGASSWRAASSPSGLECAARPAVPARGAASSFELPNGDRLLSEPVAGAAVWRRGGAPDRRWWWTSRPCATSSASSPCCWWWPSSSAWAWWWASSTSSRTGSSSGRWTG